MANNFQCSGNQIPAMEIKTIPPMCRAAAPLPALPCRPRPACSHPLFLGTLQPPGHGQESPPGQAGPRASCAHGRAATPQKLSARAAQSRVGRKSLQQ